MSTCFSYLSLCYDFVTWLKGKRSLFVSSWKQNSVYSVVSVANMCASACSSRRWCLRSWKENSVFLTRVLLKPLFDAMLVYCLIFVTQRLHVMKFVFYPLKQQILILSMFSPSERCWKKKFEAVGSERVPSACRNCRLFTLSFYWQKLGEKKRYIHDSISSLITMFCSQSLVVGKLY